MKNQERDRARVPQDILEATQDVFALSVKDLLEARDLYHNHLIHKLNVVGTAIGLYFRRPQDPITRRNMTEREREIEDRKPKKERNFRDAEIRDDSWPCVIVLVSSWLKTTDFGSGRRVNPRNIIPKRLYMPDGRVVPVCVVRVEPASATSPPLGRLRWPTSAIGGGFPVLCDVQGREHSASVGCLVTDGHTTYALTNSHVAGPPGTPVLTQLRGEHLQIGRSSDKQLTRVPFREAYPQFAGDRTFLNVDVGLIEVDDVNDWTSQVYGLGRTGELADLSEQNISLRLIDQEVVAYGAASGMLHGRIKALFYRYKSVGGYDYVSDFLIAPEPGSPQTQPGDSGTVWHLPETDDIPPRPLAVEWGAQALLGDNGEEPLNFALAASLSTVCRKLDVELVREHNTGAAPFWGVTGHYSIAAYAIEAIRSQKLRKLMSLNRKRISFEIADIKPQALATAMRDAKKNDSFVPLADVPDVIWKQTAGTVTGGRDTSPRKGPDHPTHFADIDEPRPGDHKTLRQLSMSDPANVSVSFWQAFYTSLGHTDPKSRGLLPFRVWQFYDAMVEALKARKVDEFVCAAGILSHYVGDACQPLHGSMLADGFKDQTQTVAMTHRNGTPGTKQIWPGMGIHSAYESALIDRKSSALLTGISGALHGLAALPIVADGHGAAVATVALMDRTATRIPPSSLILEYIKAGGGKSAAVLDALWAAFDKKTMATMADGARVLAMIWDSAWKAGNGNGIAQSKLKGFTETTLRSIYIKKKFVRSLVLDDIGNVLK